MLFTQIIFHLRPLQDKTCNGKTGQTAKHDGKYRNFRQPIRERNTSVTRKYFVTTKNCGKPVRVEEAADRYMEVRVFISNQFLCLWFVLVEVEMDEYDELFEIEDNFENQFADELEVLAQMEEGEN